MAAAGGAGADAYAYEPAERGWKVVGGRKRRPRGPLRSREPAVRSLADALRAVRLEDESFALLDAAMQKEAAVQIARRVEASRATIEAAWPVEQLAGVIDWLDSALGLRGQRSDVLVLGVGRIGSSRTAQLQFALALALHARLPRAGTLSLYEPLLSAAERAAASALGATLLARNEEGRHAVASPTVFVMPCCPRALYANALWANWDASLNTRVAMFGNRLREMAAASAGEADCVGVAAPHCRELPLPPPAPAGAARGGAELERAFHGQAWQVFAVPREQLATRPRAASAGSELVRGESASAAPASEDAAAVSE